MQSRCLYRHAPQTVPSVPHTQTNTGTSDFRHVATAMSTNSKQLPSVSTQEHELKNVYVIEETLTILKQREDDVGEISLVTTSVRILSTEDSWT